MAKYYGLCLTTYKNPAYSQGKQKCTGRRMLTKRPEEYVRPPQCPHCGGRKWYLDKQIVKRHKRERCDCGGLHHVHRRGTKFCYHHPEAEAQHSGRFDKRTRT